MAVLVNESPITMPPDIRPLRPVSLQVTVGVFPESSRHSNPGLSYGELSHFVPKRRAGLIQDIGCDAWARSAEGAGLYRSDGISHQDPSRDLRATGVIDDGDPFPPDLFKQPEPRPGIPGFAGRSENSERREVALDPRFNPC